MNVNKKIEFLFRHWLLLGCRWRSPYHRIAYELTARPKLATIHRLLDFGFISRASQLLKTLPMHSVVQAKLALLGGERELALLYLRNAISSLSIESAETKRTLKLLTRLSPQEAAEYWFETGNSRLSAQINAVMTPKRAVQLLAPYIPSGDEHLLIANSVSEPQEKLIQLNLYFESMGLLPVSLIDNKKKIDIGNISTNTNRSPKSRPTVSVVMTVFNGHKYIRAAALSVIQQIDVNTELIIIDDGSTDNTWKIICELQQEHPTHIRCKRLITNIGTYNAKNIGLRLCRSDYIAFQDADDWSHPERLKRAITWLQKSSQRVAVTCRYVRLNEDSIFHSPAIWPMRQWSPNTLVFRRREVLSKIGGFDTVQVGADTEYFERIRAVFGDKRIAIQNHVALLAMSLPTSLMHNPNTGPDATGYSSTRIAYREKSAEKILQSIESSQNLRMPL